MNGHSRQILFQRWPVPSNQVDRILGAFCKTIHPITQLSSQYIPHIYTENPACGGRYSYQDINREDNIFLILACCENEQFWPTAAITVWWKVRGRRKIDRDYDRMRVERGRKVLWSWRSIQIDGYSVCVPQNGGKRTGWERYTSKRDCSERREMKSERDTRGDWRSKERGKRTIHGNAPNLEVD